MEGDEGLNTVECLRGRLLAERAASKAANHESAQITKKVVELKKQLKMEIKSRNKAEKRLKFLIKKLDSLNISYVSADESSSISEKSENLSVSSSKSQFSNISKCVKDNDTFGKRHDCPSHEHNLEALGEAISENSHENVIQSSQKEDNTGSKSFVTLNNDNEEHHQDTCHHEEKSILTWMNDEGKDDVYDNSMALVVVAYVVKEEKKDVTISDGNVKDVLEALRYARECLQASMHMRRHVKSGIAQPWISC